MSQTATFIILFIVLFVIAWWMVSPVQTDAYTYTLHTDTDPNMFSIVEFGQDTIEYIKFSLDGQEVQIDESESIAYKGDFIPLYLSFYKTATVGFDTVSVKFKTQKQPVDVFVAVDNSTQVLREWINSKSKVQLNFEPMVIERTDQIVRFVLEQ
jgi:hypothetical protein